MNEERQRLGPPEKSPSREGTVSIRPYRASDAEDLQRAANHAEVSKDLREGFPFPYTLDDAVWWISRCLDEEKKDLPTRSFAVILDDVVVGGIGLVDDSPEARTLSSRATLGGSGNLEEIGYWLTPSEWNKGITTRALGLLIDRMRTRCRNGENDGCSPTTLVALPDVANRGSRRVLEHCGFVAGTTGAASEHETMPVTIKGGRTSQSVVYRLEL